MCLYNNNSVDCILLLLHYYYGKIIVVKIFNKVTIEFWIQIKFW